MSALGAQLQASLQHRVFGSAGITMPALPTGASGSAPAKSECPVTCCDVLSTVTVTWHGQEEADSGYLCATKDSTALSEIEL